MKSLLLLVDPSPSASRLQHTLASNYEVFTAADGAHALRSFDEILPHGVIIEAELPDGPGLDLLKKIKEMDPEVVVIMVTEGNNVALAVEAMQAGAEHFLVKPFDVQALDAVLQKNLKQAQLNRSFFRLKSKFETFDGLPEGETFILDPKIDRAVDIAARSPDATVLISGPTGSGKSWIAGLIHRRSARRDAPFVDINGAGLSDTLLESELFGYERGAFTDAKNTKRGLMEVAHGGTLFLDEVSELSLATQAKILKAIETKNFRRVGSTHNIGVDVRIIAAANVSLQEHVRSGKFREDLYYRLNVLPVVMPPLRERQQEIPTLVMLFLQKHAHKLNKTANIITDEAMAALKGYSWPGNVRELRNVIDRAAILCGPEGLTLDDMPAEIRGQRTAAAVANTLPLMPLAQAEQTLIRQALSQTGNNKAAAARLLGIDVKTLRRKLATYGHTLEPQTKSPRS